MGFSSRGLSEAQVQAEVDTAIAKVATNTTNKLTDARGLLLDHLDADISSIPTALNYPVYEWSATTSFEGWSSMLGTWTRTADEYFAGGGIVDNDGTRDQNDELGLGTFFIPTTGTYTAYLIFITGGVFGEAHIMIDGADEGTIDCYGGAVNTVIDSVTLGSLTAGIHSISIKAVDKNGSATAYKLAIHGIAIVKA